MRGTPEMEVEVCICGVHVAYCKDMFCWSAILMAHISDSQKYADNCLSKKIIFAHMNIECTSQEL